ncbi:UDP:flavonoid glycosyltransferase YjiC (YdhE family) [Kibdelosporangium banguiense]|uniref:UDP:flavonoid glycosyltransferase YjiC (YdhE family) n=1 Tax=Kibdelosporangium banguiense TaxID=1365924 RepID=A0ABS4TRW2_9PSEU|nr:nucleotide disphospho-sugar-binding domain-containing protein [Kibdelosporangium banguiense]MBP2327132.1 UDP:flavonoid glycosyltransferase YjiC (YdhE family) [Kibdelosporangium banguiense]
MRVLFTVASDAGRLHNLVPMIWALRTAGHDVKVAGRPDFTPVINRTGSIAVEVGAPGDPAWLADASAVAELTEFAEVWRPDVVIADDRAPAGAVAAKATGAASVRVVGPAGPSVQTSDGVATDMTLDCLPPSLRQPGGENGLIRYIPYTGPAVVPGWLRRKSRRDRVLLATTDPAVCAATFDAVSGLDIEVVWAGTPDSAGPGARIPANVRVVDTAPAPAVLPTCSAVVHDGAADIAFAALAYGLPQLAVSTRELPQLVRDIAETGAGAVVELPAADLGERINALVADESLRAGAARLSAEIEAMPKPLDLVPALAALAAACA